MKTVLDQYIEIYDKCNEHISVLEAQTLESKCYRDAYKNLDPETKSDIKDMLFQLERRRIRNLGEIGMLELLAKLGVFYNGLKTS